MEVELRKRRNKRKQRRFGSDAVTASVALTARVRGGATFLSFFISLSLSPSFSPLRR